MPDHHQLIDQIRAFVQSSDQTRSALLESLASAYAEACVEVNQRMGRCHRLLQQGLRSEAIQLADSEPKLLDSLAALDFPERADWDELVSIYGLASAPKLSVDQAQFLNEAYAQENPLQDLLRMHRRLALQRAPIKARIAVMRKLAAQDANNPIWNDDLRTFETARFRELQSTAAQAVQARDLATLTQLLGEIDQQTWVEPPPKALVQALRKADAQFRGQHTRALLADLDARLNDAFAARDPVRGRIARQEWIALTASAPLPPGDAIWDRVAPALNWLEEEDERDASERAFEEGIAALVKALDDPGPIASAELERRAHSVLQYGRGMPEGIQLRYVARLRSEESRQARRRRVVTAAAVAGLSLVGSLGFYLIRRSARSSDATQAASTILDMVELGQIEQVSGFLEKLQKADEGLLSYPPMLEARAKFQAIQDTETERVLQFDKMIREAEHAPVHQLNPPELDAARRLARQQSEKQAIEQVVQRRAVALASEQAAREKEVVPRLDAVAREIAAVEQKLAAGHSEKREDSELLGPLADARRELTDLGPQLPFVNDSLQSRATVLGRQIDEAGARLDRMRKTARLEEEMTDATAFAPSTTELARFASTLDLYIKSVPDHPRAQAFQRTSAEKAIWDDVEAWNRMVEEWKEFTAGDPPREPKARAQHCGQFLTQHPGIPDAAEISLYQKHLEAIGNRGPGADSAAGKIQQLFADPLVENIWYIKVRESGSKFKRYYLTDEPNNEAGLIRYLTRPDKKRNVAIVKALVDASDWSPQTRIANRFRSALTPDSARANWEKLMIGIANQIRAEPDIDPVLQVALLRSVLEQAAEGSEALRAELATTREALEQGEVNVSVPWMDPDDPDADRMRPKAASLVKNLPDFSGILRRAMARRDQIERQVRRFPRSIGWLARENGDWQIRKRSLPPGNADLWVIVPQEDKRGRWKKIGTIADGKSRIGGSVGDALGEGRPVFIMTGQKNPGSD